MVQAVWEILTTEVGLERGPRPNSNLEIVTFHLAAPTLLSLEMIFISRKELHARSKVWAACATNPSPV